MAAQVLAPTGKTRPSPLGLGFRAQVRVGMENQMETLGYYRVPLLQNGESNGQGKRNPKGLRVQEFRA